MIFPLIGSDWTDYLTLHCFDVNNEVVGPSLAVQATEPPIVDVSPPGSGYGANQQEEAIAASHAAATLMSQVVNVLAGISGSAEVVAGAQSSRPTSAPTPITSCASAVNDARSSASSSGEGCKWDVADQLISSVGLSNLVDMIQCIFERYPHHTPQQVVQRLTSWLKIYSNDTKGYLEHIVFCCVLFEKNLYASLREKLQRATSNDMGMHILQTELSRVGQRPLFPSPRWDSTPVATNKFWVRA